MSDSKGAVDNTSIDMDSKVDTENIVILKYNILLARVRGPMRRYVVQAKPGREAHASFESVSGLGGLVTDESTHTVFDLIGELSHGDARLCNSLHVLADLTMDFGGFAVVAQEVVVHVVHDR